MWGNNEGDAAQTGEEQIYQGKPILCWQRAAPYASNDRQHESMKTDGDAIPPASAIATTSQAQLTTQGLTFSHVDGIGCLKHTQRKSYSGSSSDQRDEARRVGRFLFFPFVLVRKRTLFSSLAGIRNSSATCASFSSFEARCPSGGILSVSTISRCPPGNFTSVDGSTSFVSAAAVASLSSAAADEEEPPPACCCRLGGGGEPRNRTTHRSRVRFSWINEGQRSAGGAFQGDSDGDSEGRVSANGKWDPFLTGRGFGGVLELRLRRLCPNPPARSGNPNAHPSKYNSRGAESQ